MRTIWCAKPTARWRQRYPQIGGLSVFLKERIPSGAGMAGGSTDAAAMIRALDQMYGLHMTWEQKKVNRSFSRRGCRGLSSHTGQHRARHRGGSLSKIDTDFTYSILVLKPKVSFSTAQMYRAIDESGQITQRYLSQEKQQRGWRRRTWIGSVPVCIMYSRRPSRRRRLSGS